MCPVNHPAVPEVAKGRPRLAAGAFLAGVLLAGVVLIVAGSPAAQAQDSECGDGSQASEGELCPEGKPPRDPLADRRLGSYLRGADERRHPAEVYDIGCDEGDWKAFMRKATCAAQAFPFAAGKWAIGVGVSIVAWALDFGIAEALTPVADTLSRVYDTSLVGPLGVRHLAWTATAVISGWHVLRSRTTRGAGEVATTFMIAAAGTFVVANPGGYLEGATAAARHTSTAVFDAVGDTVTGGDGQTSTDVLDEMMHRAFIAEPYDHINWGRRLDGACADARDAILDEGPWGSDGTPRRTMRNAGCDAEADFNEYPTDTRAVTSVVVAVAAIVTTVLLVLVALGVLIAQLTLVLVFSMTSVVFAVAMFPGIAREVLWWWLRRIAWAILAAVAAAFLLSWVAVSVTVAFTATEGTPMAHRALLALLIALFAWKVRANLNRVAETVSRRAGDHAARLAPTQTSGGALAPPGAGGLRALTRQIATDLPGGQWATYRLDARRFTRGRRSGGFFGGGGYGGRRSVGRRVIRSAGAVAGEMIRATGRDIKTIGRGAKAVAMAPVLAPRAYQRAHRHVTDKSRQARTRLDQARTTRQEWRHNARHPARTMRDAHEQARRQAAKRARRASTGTTQPRKPQPPSKEDMEWM